MINHGLQMIVLERVRSIHIDSNGATWQERFRSLGNDEPQGQYPMEELWLFHVSEQDQCPEISLNIPMTKSQAFVWSLLQPMRRLMFQPCPWDSSELLLLRAVGSYALPGLRFRRRSQALTGHGINALQRLDGLLQRCL